MSEKLSWLLACIVFSIGFAAYLQGNYINADYGVLDGSQINWGEYRSYAIINTLVWIAIILVPLALLIWKKKKVTQWVSTASCFVTAIEIVAVCIMIVPGADPTQNQQGQQTQEQVQMALSREGLFTIGEEKNTLILIVDSFDTQYMDYLLANESEYLDELEGFTYYAQRLS